MTMRALLIVALCALPAAAQPDPWNPRAGLREEVARAVPCEVQGNRAKTSPCTKCDTKAGGCDCGDRPGGCTCEAQAKAQAAPAADRLAQLLALPALHRLPDGSVVSTTLRQSQEWGGVLTAEYVRWAGMTDGEADAVRGACRRQAVVVHPVAQPMPIQYAPPAYAPGFSAGFSYRGPFGGQFGAGACVGGSCSGGR